MEDSTQISSGVVDEDADQREFDLIVLGATGVTGRCVVKRLSELKRQAHSGSQPLSWAVAGRSEARLQGALRDAGAPDASVLVVDANDETSIRNAVSRTRVLLNLAGPFSDTAEPVIEQCIAAKTSYVDVSGELPLLRRVNERFDASARTAGVQIVQMAGWEAMPADVTTLMATRRAAGLDENTSDNDGPGAGGVIRSVDVDVTFDRKPAGRASLSQSVSGGTLASIVAQLVHQEAYLVGDAAGLLPDTGASTEVRTRSPIRLRPHLHRGRLIAPAVPVAFLNPPIVHRTAALLAAEHGTDHTPARYREGTDSGDPPKSWQSLPALIKVAYKSAVQRGVISAAHLPAVVRRGLVGFIGRVVPQPGSGPSGNRLTDWSWTVRADAVTSAGKRGTATLTGTGHPGYTATATIIVAVGSHLARTTSSGLRSGCLTPALALGVEGSRSLTTPQLLLAPRAGI